MSDNKSASSGAKASKKKSSPAVLISNGPIGLKLDQWFVSALRQNGASLRINYTNGVADFEVVHDQTGQAISLREFLLLRDRAGPPSQAIVTSPKGPDPQGPTLKPAPDSKESKRQARIARDKEIKLSGLVSRGKKILDDSSRNLDFENCLSDREVLNVVKGVLSPEAQIAFLGRAKVWHEFCKANLVQGYEASYQSPPDPGPPGPDTDSPVPVRDNKTPEKSGSCLIPGSSKGTEEKSEAEVEKKETGKPAPTSKPKPTSKKAPPKQSVWNPATTLSAVASIPEGRSIDWPIGQSGGFTVVPTGNRRRRNRPEGSGK